jgi:hypothetical protein
MSSSVATIFLKTSIAVTMIIGGLLFAAGSHPPLAMPANLFFDLAYWPFDNAPQAGASYARLAIAIGGGGFVAWGTACWMLVDRLLPLHPTLAKSIIRNSALAWFAVDSTGSMLAGAPLNAAVNIVLLVSILVPLHFIKTSQSNASLSPATPGKAEKQTNRADRRSGVPG